MKAQYLKTNPLLLALVSSGPDNTISYSFSYVTQATAIYVNDSIKLKWLWAEAHNVTARVFTFISLKVESRAQS